MSKIHILDGSLLENIEDYSRKNAILPREGFCKMTMKNEK
jgi:hypothetical protein